MVDRNTKFFHTQTIVRRKRNKIHGLHLDDDTLVMGDLELCNEVMHFYQRLFYANESINVKAMEIRCHQRISELGGFCSQCPCSKGGCEGGYYEHAFV